MKILSIGTDRKLFEEGSDVRRRMIAYGVGVEELHVIVFARKDLGLSDIRISNNVYLYPTNSSSRFRYIRDAKKIGRRILASKDDTDQWIVDTQDPFETGLVGRYLSKKCALPLLVQVHTDFLSPYFKHTLLNRLRVIIGKHIIPHATLVRTVSKRIKDSVWPKLTDREPLVLPIYVEAPIARNRRITSTSHELLMICRLEPEKNIISALKTLKDVMLVFPNVKLSIVGDGSERKALEDTVVRLGLVNTVSFKGWSDDLSSYFERAVAFINTSLYEGYGRTILEAAFHDCPIITTDVGLVGDVLLEGRDISVVPIGDNTALSRAIKRLLLDAQTASQRASVVGTRLRGNHASFDEYVEKYHTMWRRCLE